MVDPDADGDGHQGTGNEADEEQPPLAAVLTRPIEESLCLRAGGDSLSDLVDVLVADR
ncbi:hypothetical protein [[Actinomadura] parvosata]|uniref:hypothetical protein n=1 Tax=[Actinomadura] parvosata TaxID=1955412 RepID=UPI0012BCF649|nr:hypothetical protein [Nonomuraea sp. ATCC 55076]